MPSPWTRLAPVALALGALVVVVGTLVVLAGGSGAGDRQAEVAARGATVMPFDLDRTTHVFTPLAGGGVQEVHADPPVDGEQVRLIREHLLEERDRFAAGDFDDPAAIHGDDMPGLAVLRARYAQVDVRYVELPDGARLVYETDEPAVIAALHDWFDAQVADHGAHAEHGGAGDSV